MNNLVKTTFLFLFLLVWRVSYAQSLTIDSLEKSLEITINETTQLKILNEISDSYLNINTDKAINYSLKALRLAKKIGDDKKTAECYFLLGEQYALLGSYDLALKNLNKSLIIRKKLNLNIGEFNCLNSLGMIYRNKGDYLNSTIYFYKELELGEKLERLDYVAYAKGNLAILFNLQGKSDLALKYFLEVLEIFEKKDNKNKIAITLSNIGNVYLIKKEYNKAINYYLQSLVITKILNDKKNIANGLGNIAVAYHYQGKYVEALTYFNSSLEVYITLGEKIEIARSINNIGSTYLLQKKYSLATDFLEKSLKIALELNSKELIKTNYQNLSELYLSEGDFKNAFKYYQLFIKLRDFIQGEKISSQISEIQTKYEVEKKQKEIVILKKENIENEFQIKKRTVAIYLILFSILILLFSFLLIIRNFKLKRKIYIEKENQLIEKIRLKERELSSTAIYISNKNSVLSQIKEDLEQVLKEENISPIIKKIIKEISTSLEKNLNIFTDWQKFREQFDEVYPGYIGRLLNKYTGISHNDLKLCVYLKMGLSNKEIASLQNVSIDGIKSANKRLKKKMNIPNDVILLDFLRNF